MSSSFSRSAERSLASINFTAVTDLAASSALDCKAAIAARSQFEKNPIVIGHPARRFDHHPWNTHLDVSTSRLVQQGQQTNLERVYHYLTGTTFRQRIDAVVEKFNDMREDLDKERKFMGRQGAKRETQILAVIESTVGMVGDLQAIAGKAMPEIPSLEVPLLENDSELERKLG
ncbi:MULTISPECIES: DUF2130 domain-containing protein [unclassified Bradyrhizobium]|uniref:DUF2130 domain-containing protein n=1 Tax=Bradyrhizobium sp. USDA 4541 TaxID=2817704 RepID=UPI0020A55C10|nr:DUF2130 domain-containing protein [Bradyrhizobium sp. USDA 4541]MCP1854455.1 hypothetical protein [Bradyrhizobium sp. USDA 4541]